jgi:hypothetical protein
MEKKQVFEILELYKQKIAWGILAIFDVLAVLVIYGRFLSRLLTKVDTQSAKICSNFPLKSVATDLLRPRYWFLLVSTVFLGFILVWLIDRLEIPLKVNRARYGWLLIVALLGILLVEMFLITKFYCWS